MARWGLVPSWAKDVSIGSRLINARVETAATKPAFRKAFAARRCLMPADGFYEWYASAAVGKGGKPIKQPFFIHAPDGRSLALAGLFEFWRDRAAQDDQPWLMSVTILTTTSTDALGRIHDRMPLPIRERDWDLWLDPGAAPETGPAGSRGARRGAVDGLSGFHGGEQRAKQRAGSDGNRCRRRPEPGAALS